MSFSTTRHIETPNFVDESHIRSQHYKAIKQSFFDTWQRTDGLLAAFAKALGPTCSVPYRPTLNPPLWEIGHMYWFYEWFICRNPEWYLGLNANHHAPRKPSELQRIDHLLDSASIAHEPRWQEVLPDYENSVKYCRQVRQTVLNTLAQANKLSNASDANPDQLFYFFKLCLLHEQMHNEASVFMANQLEIELPTKLANPRNKTYAINENQTCQVASQTWTLGWQSPGFAFDNELPPTTIHLDPFKIDAHPINWHQYLQFILETDHPLPFFFHYDNNRLLNQAFNQERVVDLNEPVSHVTWYDAMEYCKWSERQLPTEAQWECAAATQNAFKWGWAWEWTSSIFSGFNGFIPHPYETYSEPWFNDRKVLKGASWATASEMTHLKYRNFFQPDRFDIISGFRTCQPL